MFKALAPFERLIFIGQSSGKTSLIDPWKLTVTDHIDVSAYLAFPEVIQSTLTEPIGSVLSGKVSLQTETVLPLSQAGEAHRLLEGSHAAGKVVLRPWA